jgi:ABC-type transport system involved in multi-copper enzyme maturation permease subunit
MTTTLTRAAPIGATLPQPTGRAGLAGALRSEFTKIWSVRSTYWSLIALLIVTVGIGALASFGVAGHSGQIGTSFDPTQLSLTGLLVGQLIIAVLGVLTVTSEYSTGMIRTSLAAMPRRGPLIAAKAAVFAAVALITGLAACFASFFIGQALMTSHHLNAAIGQPHVLRAVIGGALFLTVCGLLGFGLGLILRHTAAAISTVIGLLFVPFILANFLPSSLQNDIDKWVPQNAGIQIWQAVASPPGEHMFSAWAGFGVFSGYAAIAIIGGLILFRKRDA